ncbi:hypothetical protein [Nitratireductor alexandrii]|uniref:hypothetical protein n=1 Tax=Nitratireductor alexandrii TaxID=2448161 RepID=UPI000FDCAF22|nr:hypothetical protein [Nitratireductor alexandrii]
MLSTAHDNRLARRHRERESERQMMKRLFFIVFPLCLAAVALARVIQVFGPRDGTVEGSVFAEAKASAYAALGYAFHV